MEQKRITIKDISEQLGVSCAVISKALNNKSGVNKELREKILTTANELGYRINKVAQSMARNTIVIGVVIPAATHDYFSFMKKGLDTEFERLRDYNVEKRYYVIENLYSSIDTIRALNQCMEDGVQGIILCDFFPSGLDKVFGELEKRNIPIVLMGDSQSTTSKYLCSVQVDAYRSGQMAAELLRLCTKENSNVAIFVGNKDNVEHKLKIQGFVDSLNTYGLNLVGVYETHDDDTIALHLMKKILGDSKNLHGLYSATSNFASIGRIIQDEQLDLKVVCTDIDSAVAYYLKAGIAQCTIFQDLEKHGRTAVRLLYEHIAEYREIDKTVYITPLVVVRSNLDAYLDS
ncbi:MAG: LacI family transcriptional regulator [Ruminococcaceae bacterium]|nr:LacI family transcriptional regulator [Oscillospiraceae bacterium]